MFISIDPPIDFPEINPSSYTLSKVELFADTLLPVFTRVRYMSSSDEISTIGDFLQSEDDEDVEDLLFKLEEQINQTEEQRFPTLRE